MSELLFNRSHAVHAMQQAKAKGRDWLYQNYPKPDGRPTKSRTGFLIHEGIAYPVKPLGRLANELAGHPMSGNPITNVFRAHFQKLGFALTDGDVEEADEIATQVEAEEAAERQRRLANVWVRSRQAQFRQVVLEAFGSCCIVTGSETLISLEAAHIIPVADDGVDEAWNGIPLRADIHRLFDAGAIEINPDTWKLWVDAAVFEDYGKYHDLDLSPKLTECGHTEKLASALRKRARLHEGS